ncbi:MAG: phosphoglycerate mutase [Gammaproteobacteria bacterium]|nr:MAG: phosphoglycerate mutase [Gammaproteobacteria bacterium]
MTNQTANQPNSPHLRLIVTRHAKSSWSDLTLSDHARPLKGRGKRAASELGQWLVAHGHLPDAVLSSDSQRTRETWQLAADAMSVAPEPIWLPDLYLASPNDLLSIVQQASGRSRTLMVIAHNPGIGEFANRLLTKALDEEDFERFPTAAALVAEFPITHWNELEFGTGSALAFFTPSERGGNQIADSQSSSNTDGASEQ